MRVSRDQIIRGIADYAQNDILPKMGNDRAVQIMATVAISAAAANPRVADAVFGSEIMRSMLGDDGSGTYELGGIVEAMRAAIEQYGSFPVRIPAIPLISPREIVLNLNCADIDAMRRRIETDT